MSYKTYNGGRGGGPGGPEDFFRELNKGIEQLFGSFKGNGGFLGVGLVLLLIVFGVFSSYYTVEPDEEAVVLRFGKYLKTNPNGLHFKLPFGVDQVVKLKTLQVKQAEFGFRTTDTSARRTTYSKKGLSAESLMLTGDLNVADVEWIVQYQIGDPQKYLFQVKDPIRTLRDVSESIMRRVVGDRLVTDVLTTGRAEIRDESKVLMQKVLDKYDVGIRVVTVELQDVNPPEVVKPSFNEVNAAKQEQEKLINQAEEKYNKIIPEARGKAEKTVSQAEGYATALVNRSKGDAERFRSVLTEYRRAPNVTRKRIYLETMEELYGKFEKLTIVDSKVKGLLPIFNKGREVTP